MIDRVEESVGKTNSEAGEPSTAHIINHTHWDREWFLTSVYTSRWIPKLIDKLEALVEVNDKFRFLLDGQTLVIEDLLAFDPGYAEGTDTLIANGQLIIGPYYCQPDWQLAGGELLIRNLKCGQSDVRRHEGTVNIGWLVDTFGHISQSPQIHRLFGIESIYVWRGVPQMEPYFRWLAEDGSQVLVINLFGGYRNLYGVTHVPEVAVRRLQAEVEKLRPFYPTVDIPLFDGYDLEDDPEDPLSFYSQYTGFVPDINLQEATPMTFAFEIARKPIPLPTLGGELNSGKYGATFPGTLSTRTYLKVMAADCRHMLFELCEPIGAMAHLMGGSYDSAQYESWARLLLQNAVHDCLCGVSVDQVHEKMEFSYRHTFDEMRTDLRGSLATILGHFKPGKYAISTNPFSSKSYWVQDGSVAEVQTDGIGVWPISDEQLPVQKVYEPVETFSWQNEYYEAFVDKDGLVRIGEELFGTLAISAEHGDTYSDEMGEQLGTVELIGQPTVIEQSVLHSVLTFRGEWQDRARRVEVGVRLHFDRSPLIRWQIDLDSRGTDLRVDMVFDTVLQGTIFAGMPFDLVSRPFSDADLLPRQPPDELVNVLLGQRELNEVSTFPFHDLVAVSTSERSVAILAKGIHSYRASRDGKVALTLRRAVEWLTKADLKDRVGDAGPFFYVPDARCERIVQHEIAIAIVPFAADSMDLQALNAAFQNPPLVVRSNGNGHQIKWQLLKENLPMSSLQLQGKALLVRFYNPTSQNQPLAKSYTQTDVNGVVQVTAAAIPAKKIVTLQLPKFESEAVEIACNRDVELLMAPQWRVGLNQGLPDKAILTRIEENIAAISDQLVNTQDHISKCQGKERLLAEHRYWILERERLELQLSHLLNRRKLAENGALSYAYLYQPDSEIAALGLQLNRARIKRRIFDYVVQAL